MGETEGLASKHNYHPAGFRGRYPVLVRSFVEGRIIDRHGDETVDASQRSRLSSVLERAHSLGFANLDVKVTNVVVRDDGLADFFDLGPCVDSGGCPVAEFDIGRGYDWERFGFMF